MSKLLTVEMIGDVMMVLPCASDHLPENRLEQLRRVELLSRAGRRTEASKAALVLEQALGITNEDRLAAVRPRADWEVELDAAMSRAVRDAKPPEQKTRKQLQQSPITPLAVQSLAPVVACELPANERGMAANRVEAWDRSREILNNPNLRLSDEQRDGRLKAMADIETRAKREAEAQAITDGVTESASLAEARGEEVTTLKSGARRVLDRDPILALLRLGKLTAEQHDTGAACRDYYEARSEGLGSQMGGLGSVGQPGYDNCPAVFNGVQRGKKLQRLGKIERAIMLSQSFTPDAPAVVGLQMLRAVCGEGKSLSSQGEGRAFERNLRAFRCALDVAGEVVSGR